MVFFILSHPAGRRKGCSCFLVAQLLYNRDRKKVSFLPTSGIMARLLQVQ